MTVNTRPKAGSIPSVEEYKAAGVAFAREIADLGPRVQAMFDSLHVGDLGEFHSALQAQIDNPAFDAAFEVACASNQHLADVAIREALRGAGVSSARGSSRGAERISDVFVLPVTGPVDDINRLVSDASSMAALERSFRDAGLVAPGGRVALADVSLGPDIVVHATPGTLRDVHRAFEEFIASPGTAADRSALEGEVEDFEAFCVPEGQVSEAKGIATMLLAGFYTREYAVMTQFDLDPLTVQISSADGGADHAASLAAFAELARDVTGLDVALPHWLGRGCAAAAVEAALTMMEAEAECYGKDISVTGLDGVALAQRGDVTLVEGEIDGHILGPFAFATNLIGYAPEWAGERFEAMARAVIPAGRLEHSRSTRLN
ncbi:hypothetical protein HFN89_06330 [Rhizobium laguerreae]|nr:hypothetical protein [Rhizobium laguerreae]